MSVTTYHSSYVGSMYADREIDADGYVKYEDYAALEARFDRLLAALKDAATVHTNILLGEIALTKAQAIHIAGLPADIEARLKALEWRRITDEDLPENGDSVWSALHGTCTATSQESMQPASYWREYGYIHSASYWHKYGYTHFRKHSAPAPEGSDAK